jgi:hypothetical protein
MTVPTETKAPVVPLAECEAEHCYYDDCAECDEDHCDDGNCHAPDECPSGIDEEAVQRIFARFGPERERLCDWRKCLEEPWASLAEALS